MYNVQSLSCRLIISSVSSSFSLSGFVTYPPPPFFSCPPLLSNICLLPRLLSVTLVTPIMTHNPQPVSPSSPPPLMCSTSTPSFPPSLRVHPSFSSISLEKPYMYLAVFINKEAKKKLKAICIITFLSLRLYLSISLYLCFSVSVCLCLFLFFLFIPKLIYWNTTGTFRIKRKKNLKWASLSELWAGGSPLIHNKLGFCWI